MANQQSRITVIGTHRRVDLAVPSLSPIGEYAPRLAELCGQDAGGAMPPAWSLARAGAPAFPIETSLYEMGVVDGSVLYLTDITTEPGDAPVVKDIDELVSDESLKQRQARMHAGPVVVSMGLLWLFGATLLAPARADGRSAIAIGLVVAALALIGIGWGLRQRRSAVPPAMVNVVVLTAVPCLAIAGILVTRILFGPGFEWAGGVAGGNLAALMALAATPSAALMAVEFQLALGAVLVSLAYGLEADRLKAAALLAAVAVGLLAVARRTTATITAMSSRLPRAKHTAADATGAMVHSAGRLMAVVMAGPIAALVVALPLLLNSRRNWPAAAAIVITIALLARARQAAFTSELIMIGGAGLVGLFCSLDYAAGLIGVSGVASHVLLLVEGFAVVGAGVAMSVLVQPADDRDVPKSGPKKPFRRTPAERIGVAAAIAVAPLTMGVFGVFSHLVIVGRTLF